MNNYFITIAIISIIAYIAMINLIYFLAPTKIIDDFPKKCSLNTKCTRIADTKNRGYGLEIIKLKSDVSNIQKKIIDFIKNKSNMAIVNEKEGFIHCVDITPFFRFYDDVSIKIFEDEGLTNIWLQSQSRLGIHDLYVNEKRIQDLHKNILKLE